MAVTDAEARAMKRVRDILKSWGITSVGVAGTRAIVAAVKAELCPEPPDRPAPEGDGPNGIYGTE